MCNINQTYERNNTQVFDELSAKEASDQILGQEIKIERRAAREGTPPHARYNRPSCRKISVKLTGS